MFNDPWMDEGGVDRPSPSIFDSFDCFGLGEMAHGSVQSETDVNHPVLKSTYLLLHLVRFVHQRPIPMHLSSKPPVFFVDEGCVDPLRPRVFAEQDECVGMRVGLSLVGAESRRRVRWLLVHRMSLPHRSPHHRFVVHLIFDEARGVEATLMAYLHGAEVGGYVVLEPGGASDNRGLSHYATYLWAARPPRPPLPP